MKRWKLYISRAVWRELVWSILLVLGCAWVCLLTLHLLSLQDEPLTAQSGADQMMGGWNPNHNDYYGNTEGLVLEPVPALPDWKREWLSDPGWNQPYLQPGGATPIPAPSFEMLLEETRRVQQRSVVTRLPAELQFEAAALIAERKGHARLADWIRDATWMLSGTGRSRF